MRKKHILYLLLLVFFASGIVAIKQYQKMRLAYLRGENIVYPESVVLGVSTELTEVMIDYTTEKGNSSPLIFGGSNPRIISADTWKNFESVGLSAVRVPFFVEHSVPNKSSVTSYLNNENNIQNTSMWNHAVMDKQTNALKEAKNKAMVTMGVLEFSPAWLSASKTEFGVPANWDVYRDIVQKIYAINRPYLDYIEIWNEPDWDHFLNLNGSKLSREDAYLQIFLNASKAIRDYDLQVNDGKRVKIGGPAISKLKNTSVLAKLVSSDEAKSYLSFISVHNYDLHSPLDVSNIKKIKDDAGLSNIPIFLTEWNYTPDEKYPNPFLVSNESIPYTGSQFIKMMKQGIDAGFYFALQPIDTQNMGNGQGYLSFYKDNKGKSELLPMSKTWQLFSETMSLGKGVNKVFMSSDSSPDLLGLENSKGEKVIIASNKLNQSKTYLITVKFGSSDSDYQIESYSASEKANPNVKSGSLYLRTKDNSITFKVVVPETSTIGIVLKKPSGLIL